MIRTLLNRLGLFLVHRTVAPKVHDAAAEATGGKLNLKLGLRLLRHREVPVGVKMAALVLGVAGAAAFQVAELPLEGILLLVMPLLGLADFALDGVEIFAVAMGVACAVLPFIAPEEVVEKQRQELDGRVVDAAGAKVHR